MQLKHTCINDKVNIVGKTDQGVYLITYINDAGDTHIVTWSPIDDKIEPNEILARLAVADVKQYLYL